MSDWMWSVVQGTRELCSVWAQWQEFAGLGGISARGWGREGGCRWELEIKNRGRNCLGARLEAAQSPSDDLHGCFVLMYPYVDTQRSGAGSSPLPWCCVWNRMGL